MIELARTSQQLTPLSASHALHVRANLRLPLSRDRPRLEPRMARRARSSGSSVDDREGTPTFDGRRRRAGGYGGGTPRSRRSRESSGPRGGIGRRQSAARQPTVGVLSAAHPHAHSPRGRGRRSNKRHRSCNRRGRGLARDVGREELRALPPRRARRAGSTDRRRRGSAELHEAHRLFTEIGAPIRAEQVAQELGR